MKVTTQEHVNTVAKFERRFFVSLDDIEISLSYLSIVKASRYVSLVLALP